MKSACPSSRHASCLSATPRRLLAVFSLASVAAMGSFPSARANVITNGTFDAGLTGWTAVTDGVNASWTTVDYGAESIGQVAQFQATNPVTVGGSLRQSFIEIASPITLTFDGNWMYGVNENPTCSAGVMLLDANGDGYAFYNRRNGIGYGVIWKSVVNGVVGVENDINVDTSQLAASGGGRVGSFSLISDGEGNWNFSGSVLYAVNPNVPGTWTTGSFSTGTAVTSFSQLWLLAEPGADNSLMLLYDNVSLSAVPEPGTLLLGVVGFAGIWLLARRRPRHVASL